MSGAPGAAPRDWPRGPCACAALYARIADFRARAPALRRARCGILVERVERAGGATRARKQPANVILRPPRGARAGPRATRGSALSAPSRRAPRAAGRGVPGGERGGMGVGALFPSRALWGRRVARGSGSGARGVWGAPMRRAASDCLDARRIPLRNSKLSSFVICI